MVRIMKKKPVKFVQKSDHKNVENSEIGPDSEKLTSNTRELVDLNFNQLFFLQALGAEALVRGIWDGESPTKTQSPTKPGV